MRQFVKPSRGIRSSRTLDVVDRQVRAYNARDIDGFVACYSEEVIIEDARGALLMRGRDTVRNEYSPFFRDNPELHGEI